MTDLLPSINDAVDTSTRHGRHHGYMTIIMSRSYNLGKNKYQAQTQAASTSQDHLFPIECSFKFLLKVGVEDSIVNAPLSSLQSKNTNNAKSEVRFKQRIRDVNPCSGVWVWLWWSGAVQVVKSPSNSLNVIEDRRYERITLHLVFDKCRLNRGYNLRLSVKAVGHEREAQESQVTKSFGLTEDCCRGEGGSVVVLEEADGPCLLPARHHLKSQFTEQSPVPYELVGAAMLSVTAPRRGGGLDKGGASNSPSVRVGSCRRPLAQQSSTILKQDNTTGTTTFLKVHQEETSSAALWMRRGGCCDSLTPAVRTDRTSSRLDERHLTKATEARCNPCRPLVLSRPPHNCAVIVASVSHLLSILLVDFCRAFELVKDWLSPTAANKSIKIMSVILSLRPTTRHLRALPIIYITDEDEEEFSGEKKDDFTKFFPLISGCYDDLQHGHVCVSDGSTAILTAGAHNSSPQWFEKRMPTNLFSYHLVASPHELFILRPARRRNAPPSVRMDTSGTATGLRSFEVFLS
ncbi:hypothetical protein GEV33_011868 [Tenebrio molitor]|uniref:Uncharacterized protein n=1 Tax=Tenebrio molitor TaxID=7067 RepID=A0A8J6L9H0_TENMO|nr:hypothetical protein GEV33_011868 [Tenebrio molitor]